MKETPKWFWVKEVDVPDDFVAFAVRSDFVEKVVDAIERHDITVAEAELAALKKGRRHVH